MPNVKIDSYCVYSNKISIGPFRGFGVSQTAWAVESQMDIMAQELGLDSLEMRLKNVVEEGSISATGEVLTSVGVKECLQKTADAIGWGKKEVGKNRGKGIACIHKFSAPSTSSCAYLKLNEDGSIGVLTSAVDIGQGSNTALAQIAAEDLGVELDDIVMVSPDTNTTPYDSGAIASRLTFHVGKAINIAARDVKKQLFRLASDTLEASIDDLEMRNRRIYVKGSPERGMSLEQLAILSHTAKGGPVLGRGSYIAEDFTPLDPETGQGKKPTEYWKYAAVAIEVAVDIKTGELKVENLAAAADAGYAINPMSVSGQVEGAAVMGVGAGLMEEVVFDHGRVVNPSFMDYKIPAAPDAPRVKSLIVEIPHPDGPFGAKGVGEEGTPPTAPAIANAIYNAIGVRITELPLTSEKVLMALKDKSKSGT